MIRDGALLATRLAVGLGVAAHGAQKAFSSFGGEGPDQAAAALHELGFRPATAYAPLFWWNEMAAGGLIAVGFGGPVGPALVIWQNSVAVGLRLPNGFFARKRGVEIPLLYISAALALAVDGYGDASFDAAFGWQPTLRDPRLCGLLLAGSIATAALILNRRSIP
jgi:putative oxidoreductase